MLARHLLFLATRRSHNALLPFTGETGPSQVTSSQSYPPPYVGPPQPRDWQKVQKSCDRSDEARNSRQKLSKEPHQRDYRICEENDNPTTYEHQPQQQNRYGSSLFATDNRRDSRSIDLTDQQPYYEPPRYGDNRRVCSRDIVKTENARNQQFSDTARIDEKQQFFTLPNRRPVREIEPPRSVTPDITRGLSRGPLSAMHMLARHGRKPVAEIATSHSIDPNQRGSQEQLQMQGRTRLAEHSQQQQPPVDARNRFVAPLGISAFGYRFFASSPMQEGEKNSSEALRRSTISPIVPGNCGNARKASTPTVRSSATVAERLTAIGNNCQSPIPGSSGRSTPTQSSSGRNTPTNLSIISPTRSTMSNEELFAAIYKSKRRLNIKDDAESLSPASSTSSLAKAPAGTRHSWSPESHKTPEIPATVDSPSATSRLDFKRLLLQQSVKIGPTRLSAAEQLKLSRQQCNQQQQQIQSQQLQAQHHQQQQQQHHHCYQQQQPQHHHYHHHQSIPHNVPQVPLAKVLSPRSVWRFQTPRTDVLSSTIIEDAAAEEKAMKPSPENPSSRPSTRRQLDLDESSADRLARNDSQNERTRFNENCGTSSRLQLTKAPLAPPGDTRGNQRIPTVGDDRTSKDSSSQQHRASSVTAANCANSTKSRQSNGVATIRQVTAGQNASQSTTTGYNCETRRINNQLARAQFLAGLPSTRHDNNIKDDNQRQSAYFEKRFRARSESPQPTIARSVARSPSAPTLETAL